MPRRDQTGLSHEPAANDALLESARVPTFGTRQDAELYRLTQLLDMQTEVLAGLAHELNTPLNSIIGFAELLTESRVNPSADQAEFLRHILAGGRQLAALTKRLGDLTQLSAQRPWRTQAVNLRTLLAEAAATLRMTLMRRRVDLTIDVSPDPSIVYGDEVGLKQIVYGMLWNAIRATPEGKCLRFHAQPEGLERFRLEVAGPIVTLDDFALRCELEALEQQLASHGGLVGAHTQVANTRIVYVVLPLAGES